MPTELGRPYALSWRGKPPHMLQPDIPVWYAFLEKWGSQFLNIYYDCLLGGPDLTPEELKDPMKKMERYLASKRADVIAELENEAWIIEVTFDAGLRSLGQVQTYRTLWIRDPKITKPEKVVIVCRRISPDFLDTASMYGILVFAEEPTTY
ncbi:hypothetical protein LCGC14_0811790 [marine sediment metagenome]|uniref:Uncharacterized protein n=1 Tax=marine sediment metagenome TaxID=412755 RepID=A0A0F9S6G1_9ZZZZ